MTLKVGVATLVMGFLLLCLMDIPVELNDKPSIAAAEIGDEGADGMLAKEFQSMEPSASEVLPKSLFG